jgi:hypothetical protein
MGFLHNDSWFKGCFDEQVVRNGGLLVVDIFVKTKKEKKFGKRQKKKNSLK